MPLGDLEAEVYHKILVVGADAPGWSEWETTLLRTVDDLCDDHRVSDARWAALAERYDEAQLLETVFTVGHYQLLAGVINTLDMPPPPP